MGVRKRKVCERLIAVLLGLAMILSLLPLDAKIVQAATLPADVSQPSSGCVFIAMEGEYVSGAAAALKRINQIRYEACKQGVKMNGRKLTVKDYVPIKWSAGLEKIARIRAAESSVTMYHQRLNGKSVFEFKYPGGGWPTSEVIAWNWSDSMLQAVEQWYSEKADYVAGNPNAVTGHYTSMIDPNNRYVGMGAFISDTATFRNTTVAQFMGAGTQSQTIAKATGKCSATIEVKKSNITALRITGKSTIDRAQKQTLSLRAVLGNYGTTSYKVTSKVKWTSSNPSIATVSSAGVVTGLKKGTTKITASIGTRTASFTVSVTSKCQHMYTGKVITHATTKSSGKILRTCKLCGHKVNVVVSPIKSVSLSTVRYKYDGKVKTPAVTVKDSKGKVIPKAFYSVTYQSGRTKVGSYKVTVKFKGWYAGTVVRKFTILK